MTDRIEAIRKHAALEAEATGDGAAHDILFLLEELEVANRKADCGLGMGHGTICANEDYYEPWPGKCLRHTNEYVRVLEGREHAAIVEAERLQKRVTQLESSPESLVFWQEKAEAAMKRVAELEPQVARFEQLHREWRDAYHEQLRRAEAGLK